MNVKFYHNYSDNKVVDKNLTQIGSTITTAVIKDNVSVTDPVFTFHDFTSFNPATANYCYIDSLNRYKLLIIDDLGAERKSEYMQELIYNLIDSRYRSGLPMIITTNLSADEIKRPGNMDFARIYDRVLERCLPIAVQGESRRRRAVIDNYSKDMERLGLS